MDAAMNVLAVAYFGNSGGWYPTDGRGYRRNKTYLAFGGWTIVDESVKSIRTISR
jgi:hypothetical protein